MNSHDLLQKAAWHGLQRLDAMRQRMIADAERMESSNTVDLLNAATVRERAQLLEIVSEDIRAALSAMPEPPTDDRWELTEAGQAMRGGK